MLRCPSSRYVSRRIPGVALSFALVSFAAAPAAAQSINPSPPVERYDDPVGNGIAIGAALGAITGVVITGALYAHCNDLCDAPAEAPTYAMYAGLSAGAGAGVGWLVDKLHKGKRPRAVPVAVNIRADRQERAVQLQWRF